MIPVRIEHATRVLGPPEDVGKEHCCSLAIRDIPSQFGNQMWSAWEPTPQELQLLQRGARLFLVITGVSHPMVSLAVGTHVEVGHAAEGGQ